MAAEVAVYNEIVSLDSTELARKRWETEVTPCVFGQGGYRVTQFGAENMVYQRRHHPTWVIVVCILFFPIRTPCAALANKNVSIFFLWDFESYGSGTKFTLRGSAKPKTKEWLDGFAETMNNKARAASAPGAVE